MAPFHVCVLFIILILPQVSRGQNLKAQTCSRRNMATIQSEADAWIGGILSLNEQGTGPYGCGKPGGDMQAYEAISWVLELLNKKNETLQTQLLTDYYVPGIRLGMMVRNYCSKELSAIASITDIFPELNNDVAACTAQTNSFTLGIIGASTSGEAVLLSDSTVGYNIPVVSYEARATQLTKPGLHPNFMRTISPDGPLMEVITQVMIKLQWNFVAVVYSSDDYGRTAYSELQARLAASKICLTAGIMIDGDDMSTAKDTLNRAVGTNAKGAVYFGPGSYFEAMIREGNDMQMLPRAESLQWLLTDLPLDTVFAESSVYQRGIISITAASRFIVEFEDHWIRLDETKPPPDNPWFAEWYENKYNCKFNPTAGQQNCGSLYAGMDAKTKELRKRAAFQQSQYVEAAVMSVYTYAYALRQAQMTLCPGVSGACPKLLALPRDTFMKDYIKKVNFTFTADERVPSLASNNVPPYNAAKQLSFNSYGDVTGPSYFIYNYNDLDMGATANKTFKFRMVGSYIGTYLDLNLDNVAMYMNRRQVRQRPLPSAPCPTQGCTPCLGLPSEVKYYFEQGDVIINGIFSLHQLGLTPLTCGPMMSVKQYQYLEALIYAVRKVNQDNTIRNIKLGGLGLDDCSSPTLGQAYLAQVQRGNLQIVDKTGSQLDPRKIEAYTAADTDTLTLPLAEAMNTLMKPLVGYRATSSKLDDRLKYPYFLRALPGNYEEMKAIILFLKYMKWMYVQVVTSSETYSVDSEKIFRELASRAGICIVATHNMGGSSQDADDAVTGLGINSATQPTVILIKTDDIRRLLVAFNNSQVVRARLALIGTNMWGTDPEIVAGLETVAEGLITISLRHSSLNSFSSYLSGLSVNTYSLNPWFKEWYMAAHNCSLEGQGTGEPCNTSRPITDGVNFRLFYEVDSVINAVRAVGYGLDAALQFHCGPNYNSICTKFLTAQNKGLTFVENIRSVTFPVEDMAPPNTFRFDGQSAAILFNINNYVSGSYQLVGSIDTQTNMVAVTTSNVIVGPGHLASSISPSCAASCSECLFTFNYLDYWYVPGDVVIGSIFDVHYPGKGPFQCGPMRLKNGAMYTEVFNFALQMINSGTASVKLTNVTLGGLSFDGCSNAIRSTAIINQVHTGMNIEDPTGLKFMTSDLISWMSYDSQTTVDAATLVQQIGMPIVSPGATTPELDNKTIYNTFFRTIPSDTIIARGMAQFFSEIGKGYVIVLNAPDASNRKSRDLFREYLASYGICVVANYEFETDGSMDVIVNNIDNADTKFVAVFAEPNQHIEAFLEAKKRAVRDNPLIYVANRPWGSLIQTLQSSPMRLTNSVFFDLSIPIIEDFKKYMDGRQLTNNTNPWFQDIYQTAFKCDLPGNYLYNRACAPTSSSWSSTWEQDIWTLSTINAVYALAEGVHRTLEDKCGSGYSGMCPSFMYDSDVHSRIISNMDLENFTDITNTFFQFIQREANTNYKLKRYTDTWSTPDQGTLDTKGNLMLNEKNSVKSLYANVDSKCTDDCLVCSPLEADLQDFTFSQGDFYIVGLFDVHMQGKTPFTCGDINKKHGLPLLEAFLYALEYVNTKKGIFRDKLPGVLLGGIGLDMCQSPSRAASLVANIHSGNLKLVRNGIAVNPNKIDTYIAAMDTESTIRVADILTQLAIPQISYGATGMDLLNDKYSYFLRSVPADDKQARAVVSYLKKFGFNNIQVVNSFDEIGEPGMMEFKRLAFVNEICITKEYTVGETGNVAADTPGVISQIAQRRDAQVVVLWFKNPLPILEAANSNPEVNSQFLFIATEKWGADPDYLTNSKISSLLTNRNLVILGVETADIHGFDQYLEYKNPDNYTGNPWFKDYFEMLLDCSWDTTGKRSTKCDKSSTIPRAGTYKQDSYVLYVINAVFSAALSIDSAISKVCSGLSGQHGYYGACSLYSTSGERRQKVMQGLLEVNFTDDTHQPFFYTKDRQSDRGFHIYNVTSTATGTFQYTNVGSYNDTHFLKLDITYNSAYKAKCDANRTDQNVDDCVCEFKPDLPSRYMKKANGGSGLSVVYIGDIHQADPANPLSCGPINTGVDLQKLLAFFYAIDVVNNDKGMPTSLKLDGLALDSCTHGLQLGQDVYNVLSGNQLCESDNRGLVVAPSTITAFVIDKDSNALPVASILSQQKITSISPTAGSALLNDQFMYPYFLRTRGDNTQTAQVLLEIAHQSLWDYISVVYTDTLAYRDMADSLLDRSQDGNTCVGAAVPLPTNATLDDAKLALDKLGQQIGATAVILFVEPSQLNLLLQASQSLGMAGRFVWVVASDWAQDSNQFAGYEQELAGALFLEVRSAILANFLAYVKSLNYTNRGGIPDDWFEDIYQTLHKCNILKLEHPMVIRYSKTCTLDEVITDDMVKPNPEILHVMLSVLAIANGLKNIPECNQSPLALSACLQLQPHRYNLIYNGISTVNFQVPEVPANESFRFSFDNNGNGEAGYVIRNYRITPYTSSVPYMAYQIGDYSAQGLNLNTQLYAGSNLYDKKIPSSSCAMGSTCTCLLSRDRTSQWTYSPAQVLDPASVKVGRTYKDPQTGELVTVEAIPEAGDRFQEGWAIVLSILACLGAAVSLAIFIYLLIMYPVRGGTTILGFILCFGIVLLYLMAFPFIAHADIRICGLRRFGLGFVYSIVYSALMVKLVDCWRVRAKNDPNNIKYSKLGTPFGLFMVTVFFVLVQVMINAEWLILREPGITRIFYQNQFWPRCTTDDFYDESLVLSLVYIMVIIMVSLLLGLATYRTVKNHRESRWILCILVISVICWVVWCTASIMGAKKMRDGAVVIGLLVNATAMLLLMPIRKLYLLHKYHITDEDGDVAEKQSTLAASQRGTDYNSVYGRQYDSNPKMHDAGSVHGSSYLRSGPHERE